MSTLEEIYGKKPKIGARAPVGSSSITPENTTLDDIYNTPKKKKTTLSVKEAVAELPERKGYQATMNKISDKIGGFEAEAVGGLIEGSGRSLDALNTLGKNLFLGLGGARKQVKDAQDLDQANQNYQNIILTKLKTAKAENNEKETKRLMRIVDQMTKNTPQNYDILTRPESIKSPFDQAIPSTQEFAAKMDKIADKAGLSEFSKALGKGIGQFTADSPALLLGGAGIEATGLPKIASRIFLDPKAFPTIGKYVAPYIANSLTNIGAFGALSATHGGDLSTVVRDSMLFSVFPSLTKPGFLGKAITLSGDAALMGGMAKLDGASDQDAAVAAVLGGIMGVSGALGERSVGGIRQGVKKLKGVASDKINEFSDIKIKPTSVHEEILRSFEQAKTKAKTETEKKSIEVAKEILTDEHPIIQEVKKEQAKEIEELASNFRPAPEPEAKKPQVIKKEVPVEKIETKKQETVDKPVDNGDKQVSSIEEISKKHDVEIIARPEEAGTIHVDHMKSKQEGKGNFKRAIDDLIKYATDTGKRITVTPGSDFDKRIDPARLEKTFRDKGFIDNPLSETQSGKLVYEPKAKEVPRETPTQKAPEEGVPKVNDGVLPPKKLEQERETKASAVYERLKEDHPELTDDSSYEAMQMKKDAEKAVDLLATDKELAYKVAMNVETLADQTNTAVNIAMAEQALREGNLSLYNQLVKNRSFAQTRRGQEIVAEKGSVTDNSTARYFKELLNIRMEKLGDRYLSDVRDIFKKTSKKKQALEAIDKEVVKAQKKLKNKEIDLAEAQKLIDALMCK